MESVDILSPSELLIQHLRDFLVSDETKNLYRINDRAFRRQRHLDFKYTVVGILNSWKIPFQNRMNEIFADLTENEPIPTASAFCQAREKVQPLFFKRLNTETVTFFYTKYAASGLVKTWIGKRLLAVDGSRINFENIPETRAAFTLIGKDAKHPYVQGQGSFLYDVLNDVVLNAELGSIEAEKNALFNAHVTVLTPNDIVIYDRLYADYSVLSWHAFNGLNYIIRSPTAGRFMEVEHFAQSTETDRTIILQCPVSQKKFVQSQYLPTTIKVRLIKVILDTGEMEILMTNLFDMLTFPAIDFKQLYHLRWVEETYLNHLKNTMEVERFSSSKLSSIYQDFYAAVFMTSLEAVLGAETNAELLQISQEKGTKYLYKRNRAIGATSLASVVLTLLCDQTVPPKKFSTT